jgi:small glutamine-rich tetratricopeptide repeat-containing protein alpha
MPDFSQLSQMMNNPQFMAAAQQMMQNPEFSKMVANMAGSLGLGSMADPSKIEQFMQNMANPEARQVDSDGNLVTPFGKINKEALEKLQREKVESNPKFAAVMQDVQTNGFAAFQKYIGDPDVMALMTEFQSLMMNPESKSS